MQMFHFVSSFSIAAYYVILLPFVGCPSHEELIRQTSNHKNIKENLHELSPRLKFQIAVHGFLLWASIGFLMPIGIITIRMSNREENGRKARAFLYLHVVFQILSLLLATVGAIMSMKNFENSFNNNHQRLGLALYAAMWVQASIGFFKPPRGNKRSTWYFVHWLLGTAISLVGIINIYTGLKAYHNKTSRSTTLWTIFFTAEISFMAFFYLFQDKWDYMQKQGVVLGNNSEPAASASAQVISGRDNEKLFLPEPCGKRNALRNLFD